MLSLPLVRSRLNCRGPAAINPSTTCSNSPVSSSWSPMPRLVVRACLEVHVLGPAFLATPRSIGDREGYLTMSCETLGRRSGVHLVSGDKRSTSTRASGGEMSLLSEWPPLSEEDHQVSELCRIGIDVSDRADLSSVGMMTGASADRALTAPRWRTVVGEQVLALVDRQVVVPFDVRTDLIGIAHVDTRIGPSEKRDSPFQTCSIAHRCDEVVAQDLYGVEEYLDEWPSEERRFSSRNRNQCPNASRMSSQCFGSTLSFEDTTRVDSHDVRDVPHARFPSWYAISIRERDRRRPRPLSAWS